MKSTRVLVVDDHHDSADMLATVLRVRDAALSVQTAYDGESGLAQALSEPFDAVVLDLLLPLMSGAQVAQEIRSQLPGAAAPLLIALSGSVAELARHRQGLDFDHALTKPVNVDRLLGILRQN